MTPSASSPATSETRCVTCEKRSGSRKRSTCTVPGPADAREVVAAEVDEHHVLGAVLLGGEQPLGVALARLRRAGDRVQRGARALALDERLGRGADEREAVELEQEEVRRRVDAAQRAVERERATPTSAARRAARARSGTRRRRGCAPCTRRRRARTRPATGGGGSRRPRAGLARRRADVALEQLGSVSPGRRAAPRRRRARGRSGRACRRRRSGSRAGRARRPASARSARASRRSRSAR